MKMKDSVVESRNKSPHPLPTDQAKVHAESGLDGATLEQTGFVDPLQQMEGITGGGDMQTQAATLRRLTGAQQQQMFKRIGQLQGNRHAQQLVPTLIPTTKSDQAKTASLDQGTPMSPRQTASGEVGEGDQPAQEQPEEMPAQAQVEKSEAPKTTPAQQTEAAAQPPAAENKTEEVKGKKAAQTPAEEKRAGEAAPEQQAETPAQAPTGEAPNEEQPGLFPAAPPVGNQVSATIDALAATPPTQIPKILAQTRPQIANQQQAEQERFTEQWGRHPDVARLLMNPPAAATPEATPQTTTETPSKETDETEIKHIKAAEQENAPTKKKDSAGTRPKVALVEKANPTLIQENRETNQLTLAAQRAQMDAAANADFGETRVAPTEIPEMQAAQISTPTADGQPSRPQSAALTEAATPPIEQLPGDLSQMVDQVFAPKVNERFQEVQAQQQQHHVAYQQEMQTLQTQGEQELTAIAQETQQEQANIQEQSSTQVGQVKQEWQAENQRLEAEHNAQAAAMQTQVDQQIQNVVSTHEQQSDQTLTTAENEAESTRNQAEAEADRIRNDAEREAAAQQAAQQEAQEAGEPAPKTGDPMAKAQALITALLAKMGQEVTKILNTGRTEAGQQVAEGTNLVEKAIAELRAQFMAALDDVLAEYPLLMLWAEMKINQVLDQATETLTKLAATADASSENAYDFIQRGMQSMLKQYQTQCLNIMDQATKIKAGGLDAAETETMVEELATYMNKNKDKQFVADQTKRVQELLGGYGMTLTGDAGLTWGYAESLVMLTAVDQLDHRLTQEYKEHMQQEAYEEYLANGDQQYSYGEFVSTYADYFDDRMDSLKDRKMFSRVYGNDLKFMRVGASDKVWGNSGSYPTDQTVKMYANAFGTSGYGGGDFSAVQNAIHELGHVFEWRVGHPTDSTRIPRGALGDQKEQARKYPDEHYWPGRNEGFAGPGWGWQQNRTAGMDGEEFADMYTGWAYNEWAEDPETGEWTEAGQARSDWMGSNMDDWTDQAVNR